MRKPLAIAGITAASLIGGAVAGVTFMPTLVGAQTDTTTTVPATSGSTTTPAATAPTELPPFMTDALKGLVDAGTLTQAQADAVSKALLEKLPARGPHGGGMKGAHLDVAATALGMTTDELRTELEAGKTLATIAGEQGVDVQTVINALVADAEARLAQAVTDGKLTQAEADERKAELTTRISDMVNNGGRMGGRGHHGGGMGGRWGGPGTDSSSSTQASGTSA